MYSMLEGGGKVLNVGLGICMNERKGIIKMDVIN